MAMCWCIEIIIYVILKFIIVSCIANQDSCTVVSHVAKKTAHMTTTESPLHVASV